MKQQLKETITYQPNDGVKVTVNNKPTPDQKTGEIFYEQTVTIKIVRKWEEEKLSFATPSEMEAFVEGVDWEDPQQELPL